MDSSWFKTEFQTLTGYAPYPWQEQVFNKLVQGEVPSNLNLPTGSGKTSVIPVWLLAFIKNPALPRRIVYVVDRRSVVDQATAVVEKIVTQLSPELKDALKAYSLKNEAVLGVSTLRGEFVDNGEWSKLPSRPAVLVGTVDMVGSRLLFSGYGDGAYSRPKQAGHYRTGFHWIVLVTPIVAGFLIGLLSLAAFLSGSGGYGVCVLLVAVLIVASAFLRRSSAEFAVTNKRVILKAGLMRRRSIELLNNKIESISVNQGLLGRGLDYGTVIVRGTGGTAEPFPAVRYALEFRSKCKNRSSVPRPR